MVHVHNLIERYNGEVIPTLRVLSMNPDLVQDCVYITKYNFHIEPDILLALMRITFRGESKYTEFIKRNGNNSTEKIEIFIKIKNFYKWSERELKEMKPLLELMFEDPQTKKEYHNFFGVKNGN